ncbi:hypothetical protein FO519_006137 [Halicephalobus sp. NKZ332]|nr:hypothetical protein FO519_006137 [Halicephalobus sp. NKZ332]
MSTDLVARAVPCALPASDALKNDDGLVEDLKKLSIQSSTPHKKEKKAMRTMDTISPADYVTLQSLRSSALARKTNTTSKFTRDGANLFADLLQTDEPLKKEEKEKKTENSESDGEKTPTECSSEPESTNKAEEKETEENSDGELLPRGPVRSTRTPVAFHPYGGNKNIPYGIAPQTVVDDVTSYNASYNYDYPCGQNFYNHDLVYSNSSTPDTVVSDTGYSSATSPQGPYQQNYYQHPTSYYQQYQYPSNAQPASSTQSCSDAGSPQENIPFNDRNLTSSDLNRLLATNNDEDNELPESLSDFILKYSRRYKNEDLVGQKYAEAECSTGSNDSSPRHYQRPSSTDSGCDSPLSAVSAPQTSPAQPRGGISGPSTPNNDRLASNTGPVGNQQRRIAKEKLRALIRDDDMDQAWAWTCKCMMYFPGALSYQDPDRDTLLHIVTRLMDWAKIFTLVERMIKMDNPSGMRMFDMPNKMNETPLFLAAEKGCPEIVEYLLEAGANPNIQTSRPERDAPLHFAAARGMTPVVSILCSHPRININGMNGMGLTALLCAVKTHGVLDEESQSIIDSRPTIQALLAYGADPAIPDATNGKTVIHYAVDRMDQSLIEVFMNNLPDEAMTSLVNKPDLCNETPLKALQSTHSASEQTRSALCLTLITCGANNQNQQSDYHQSY